MGGAVAALFGETFTPKSEGRRGKLTHIGKIAAGLLLVASIATVAQCIAAKQEMDEQQRRLEDLLQEISANADKQSEMQLRSDTALREKQDSIEELEAALQKLREPKTIYSETKELGSDGRLALPELAVLRAGDKVSYRVFSGKSIEVLEKKMKLPFGGTKNLRLGETTIELVPTDISLQTSDRAYSIDYPSGEFKAMDDAQVRELQYSLPRPNANESRRVPPRIEITVVRSNGG